MAVPSIRIGCLARRAGLAGLAAAVAVLALAPSGAGAAASGPLIDLGCGLSIGGAPAATAHVDSGGFDPGLSEPAYAKAYRRALRHEERTSGATTRARPTATVRIPVYVHVIQEDDGSGGATDLMIADAMAALNAGFAGTISPGGENTGFAFDLVDTDRTNNSAWLPLQAVGGPYTALREGGRRALNVYLGQSDGTFAGVSTLPESYASQPNKDGLAVDRDYLPGGGISGAEGDVLTHEAGHWLGLFHVWGIDLQCDPDNDLVADTPELSGPTSGCPVGADTCTGPSYPGEDPIHNFMNYSSDACIYQFTPGQADRMHEETAAFRNSPPSVSASGGSIENDDTLPIEATATDPEADAVTYRVSDPPDHGSVSGSGSSFTYVPNPAYVGPDKLTLAATDAYGAEGNVDVPITVRPAPVTATPAPSIELTVTGKKQQKLRRLAVKAGCGDRGCDLDAKAKIKAEPPKGESEKARKFSSKAVEATAAQGATEKLKLALSKGKADHLADLLGSGWSATAKVKVSGTDAAGNSDSATLNVAIE